MLSKLLTSFCKLNIMIYAVKVTTDLFCFQGDGREPRLKLLEPGFKLIPYLALRAHLTHLEICKYIMHIEKVCGTQSDRKMFGQTDCADIWP